MHSSSSSTGNFEKHQADFGLAREVSDNFGCSVAAVGTAFLIGADSEDVNSNTDVNAGMFHWMASSGSSYSNWTQDPFPNIASAATYVLP